MARALYHAGKYESARSEALAALELDPHDRLSLRLLAAIESLRGATSLAAEALVREARVAGAAATELVELERALAEDGLDGTLRLRLRSEGGAASLAPVDRAAALVQLGRRDEALRELERAFAERRPDLVWLRVDPLFDPLRGEPAFRSLLARLEGRSAGLVRS
jgi:tetratricopeptide (TPR) repeat protein